ncbi:MAG: IS110 family transposase [Candidatus Freyarchaeota archaeon]
MVGGALGAYLLTAISGRTPKTVRFNVLACNGINMRSLFGKSGLGWLRGLDLNPLDRLVLDGQIEFVECLNKVIVKVEREIKRACLDGDVRLLLSLTGVGVYSALLIKSEIGDVRRFPNYKKLISWAGLAPSLYQSGSVERHGRITKQGSRMLRWVMVECAKVAVRHDGRFGEFYERVRRRRGDGKAIVAVAAKILKIIWFMLTRREPYQSRNPRLYGDKLYRLVC